VIVLASSAAVKNEKEPEREAVPSPARRFAVARHISNNECLYELAVSRKDAPDSQGAYFLSPVRTE
jgi:hypothetical protein